MEKGDPVELTIQSYDGAAEEYSRFHFRESFERRLESFMSMLPEKATVLDVGCGCGRDVKYLSEHSINPVGIDLSKGIITQAKKLVPYAAFCWMDMRKLGFKSSSFAGILAMASLLHIPKRQMPELMGEFHRVLRSDGLLHITVMLGRGEKIVVTSAAVKDMGPRFFTFYSEEELDDLLSKTGYSTEYAFVDRYLGVDWLNICARKI